MRERASELEWLRWFYAKADFGPADGDVRLLLKEDFMAKTGKNLPQPYNTNDSGDDSTLDL